IRPPRPAFSPYTTLFRSLRLRSFRDERGRELLDLPRALLASADVQAPVRLLPRWEELLLSHQDRSLVLPDEYSPQVIAVNGEVRSEEHTSELQSRGELVC